MTIDSGWHLKEGAFRREMVLDFEPEEGFLRSIEAKAPARGKLTTIKTYTPDGFVRLVIFISEVREEVSL